MMEPVAWAWRNNADEQFVATLDEPEICWEKQPLVRLSDAEARIAELIEWKDMWKGIAEANEARAEAAEALLKEAGNCMGIVLKNAKRVDMHGNGALSDIVGPWYMDQMRAIHDKIGVKDE